MYHEFNLFQVSWSLNVLSSGYFSGYVLNFCCAFIVAVMLRNLITLARTNGFASILPLDEHIYFHKMAGWFIFIYSAVHTIAHFINFGKRKTFRQYSLHPAHQCMVKQYTSEVE